MYNGYYLFSSFVLIVEKQKEYKRKCSIAFTMHSEGDANFAILQSSLQNLTQPKSIRFTTKSLSNNVRIIYLLIMYK